MHEAARERVGGRSLKALFWRPRSRWNASQSAAMNHCSIIIWKYALNKRSWASPLHH